MQFEIDPAIVEIRETYPTPVANAFAKVLGTSGEVGLHQALLELAETVLQYLALIAWFEYVAHGPRSDKLDEFVGRVGKPSMGAWKDLLREASRNNPTSLLSFPVTEKLPADQSAQQSEFVARFDAVKEGLTFDIPASGLGNYVDKEVQKRQPSKLTMHIYWEKVVECRNNYAHAADKRWPSGAALFAILNPSLRASLVELLCMDVVRRAMVDHPWARPSSETSHVVFDGGRYRLQLTIQNRRFEYTPLQVSSPTPFHRAGYLVRATDRTLYVPFEWGAWPSVPARSDDSDSAVPPARAESGRLAKALERYEERYREYLLDDGEISAKEASALDDLVELSGVSLEDIAAVRARVEAEPAVRSRLEATTPTPPATEGADQGLDAPTASPVRKKWTEAKFLAAAADNAVDALRTAIRCFRDLGLDLRWGTGVHAGSMNVVQASVTTRAFVTFYTDGQLRLNFGALNGPAISLRDGLRNAAIGELGWDIPEDYKERWVQIPADEWVPALPALLGIVKRLVTEGASASQPFGGAPAGTPQSGDANRDGGDAGTEVPAAESTVVRNHKGSPSSKRQLQDALGEISAKEASALDDLVEHSGLSLEDIAAVRARVEAEPAVRSRLEATTPTPPATEGADQGLDAPTASPARKKWTEAKFLEAVADPEVDAMRSVIRSCRDLGLSLRWGTGAQVGSLNVVQASVSAKSFLTFYSDGRLSLNFGWLRGPALSLRDRLRDAASDELGWDIPVDYVDRWVQVPADQWVPALPALLGIVKRLVTEGASTSQPFGGAPAGTPQSGDANRDGGDAGTEVPAAESTVVRNHKGSPSSKRQLQDALGVLRPLALELGRDEAGLWQELG